MGDRDKDKRGVEFEAELERQQAIEHLEAVIAGIRSGVICVQQGSRTMAVHPGESLRFLLKVKRKGERESVSFELAWEAAAISNGKPSLQISDREPPLVSASEG
jgi:amphi-Trp domain-containing protein